MTLILQRYGDWIRWFLFMVGMGAFYVGAMPLRYATHEDVKKVASASADAVKQELVRFEDVTKLTNDGQNAALASVVSERNLKLSAMDARIVRVEDAVMRLANMDTAIAVLTTKVDAISREMARQKNEEQE